MHFSSTVLLLATVASGVVAHPGHRHHMVHERRHVEKRDPMMFYMDKKPSAPAGADDKKSGNDSANVDATTPPAAPPVAPASTDDKKTENVPNTSGNGDGGADASNDRSGSGPADTGASNNDTTPPASTAGKGTGVKKPFCGGAATNIKRATALDIAFKGNVGAAGQWGCNIMEVPCADASLYDYTTMFVGGPSADVYSCSAFNKIGPTDDIDPGWHSALDFSVAKGETKCLAYDKNSQGSIACNKGPAGPQKTQWGQMASTWYEFDCGSDKNDHQSGSDVSVLVANSAKMPFIGMAIEAPGKGMCSWIKETGEMFQAYVGGMEDLDGVGCTGYAKGQTKVTLGY